MSKNIDYFEYFTEISSFACEQAKYLHETLSKYDAEKLQERIKHMHSFEHNADVKKADMIAQLIKEFLPPFDRDDIMTLAELYDTVCDTIDDVLLKFYMYDIKKCTDQAVEISAKIIDICRELHELTIELRGFKRPDALVKKVIMVNSLEDEGDRIYTDVMHSLFAEGRKDAKTLLSWSSIYSGLEDCFDACENTADMIRNIIIKNS